MKEKASLKKINLEKIRTYMKEKEESSKSEIARYTNLSFPTVTRLLDELCSTAEITNVGQGDSTGGRCASFYRLNYVFSLCLLIQIEGSIIKWIIKDLKESKVEDGEIVFEKGILETIDLLIMDLTKKYARLKAIVIGVAATVEEDTVGQTIALEEFKGINLPLHFQNLTAIAVQIENDMNLVSMGQWYQSREKVSSSASIYLGAAGFGAGTIVNGEVWKGATHFSGELGYLPFLEDIELYLKNGFQNVDIVELYTKIIQVYAAVLNPEQIVLYNNVYIVDKIDKIRQNCRKYLPLNIVPHIEISNSFQQDYEAGLYATAQKLISNERRSL